MLLHKKHIIIVADHIYFKFRVFKPIIIPLYGSNVELYVTNIYLYKPNNIYSRCGPTIVPLSHISGINSCLWFKEIRLK